MLYIWNKIDIPPNPNKNEIIIKLKIRFWWENDDIRFKPLVISKKPKISDCETFSGIPVKLSR